MLQRPPGCSFSPPPRLFAEKLTPDERIEILRGMLSEYATAKILFPKSKKPLDYQEHRRVR